MGCYSLTIVNFFRLWIWGQKIKNIYLSSLIFSIFLFFSIDISAICQFLLKSKKGLQVSLVAGTNLRYNIASLFLSMVCLVVQDFLWWYFSVLFFVICVEFQLPVHLQVRAVFSQRCGSNPLTTPAPHIAPKHCMMMP